VQIRSRRRARPGWCSGGNSVMEGPRLGAA
jgi:hypothetical protein